MKLSDYDLRQIDEERINELSESAVKNLSITLLNDLKEARERLNQNSKNSSIPPSSEAPWDNASKYEDEEKEDASPGGDIEAINKAIHADQQSLTSDCPTEEGDTPSHSEALSAIATTPASPQQSPRKPGKQPGAQGFGRDQKIPVHQHEHHYPAQCALCNLVFNPEHTRAELGRSNRVAYTAFDTLTLEWGSLSQPGITVVNTRHTYYDSECPCGHVTQEAPLRQPPDNLLPKVELSQWRLIGSSLAALIVGVCFRMRLSRSRIREFLHDWLGITLSVGSIIMSDGYRVYRQFLKRIRCWAHLVRKARGLMESYDKESQAFGKETLDFLNSLIEAIKNARETPPDKPLSELFKDQLISYRQACEKMQSSTHKKTHAY